MSDELYGRQCSLVVGNAQGAGLDLSELRVKFTVNRADTQSPANAQIRVYNLSDDTADIIQQEFTHVVLQAGYESNFGTIFQGAVRQYRKGRESATDTFLDILAQDGDEGYNFAITNTGQVPLAAGWDQTELHTRLLEDMEQFDITPGYVPGFGGPAMPRGKAIYGMTRDSLRGLANASGTYWHLSEGELNMIPIGAALPGEAVVLTAATGMVGLPQQTLNGIIVKSLLNPRIKHGAVVQLNNASIQQQSFNIAYAPGSANSVFTGDGVVQNTGIETGRDGDYKVFAITMTGDTRGPEWYSDLICVGLNATAPLSGPYINAVASSSGY